MSSARPGEGPTSLLGQELRDLVESLANDADESDHYIQYAGLYVPDVDGQAWNRGSSVGRSQRVLVELTRSARDWFADLDGSGTADEISDAIAASLDLRRDETGPHFYYWKVPTYAESPSSLLAWAWASRRSSSGFTPLVLRQLATNGAALVRKHANSISTTFSMLDLANCGDITSALEIVCGIAKASAAILWEFNYASKMYTSLSEAGIDGYGGETYRVQLGGTELSGRDGRAVRRGIVGLLRPESDYVAFDERDPSAWRPRMSVPWVPHDAELFESQRWRSCIAWPVLSDGLLVGAVSVYSRQSLAGVRVSPQLRVATSTAFHGTLRASTYVRDLERVEQQLNDEIDRIGISLMALGHVHDFADRIGSARSALDGAELAMSANHVDEARGELLKVKKDLNMLAQLTENLKRLSRETSERTGHSDAREVLNGLSGFLETFVKREGRGRVDISIAVAPTKEGETYVCAIDALRLERVLVNLVSNAVYWTKEAKAKRGSIRVRARAASATETPVENQTVTIEVVDDGVGMSPDVRAHVFERFYSRRSKGTGMGLYFAKRFVEEVGGKISVASESGAGAAFRIELPRASGRDGR